MKKLLGIIVLSLILSGAAYAKKVHDANEDGILITECVFSWGGCYRQAANHCAQYKKFFIHVWNHQAEKDFTVRLYCVTEVGKYFYEPLLKKQLEVQKTNFDPNSPWATNSESNIAEKPKKKKLKKLPEDNKVVAASSGTGFIVSKEGHIITNNHVVDSCNTIKVTFKGNEIDAKTLAVDKMNDIAIVQANIKPKSIFPVSNEDVSLLEDVVVAGYPLGKRVSSAIKTHKGVVTALAGAGDNYSNFQTDASINQGNSGGPIMNQKGNIVGIAVATWVQEGVQGVHFGIKSSTLKTFANSNSLKFSSPNYQELSNKDLGKLITDATVYLECHMTVAKIKRMLAEAENRKAFFSEYQ